MALTNKLDAIGDAIRRKNGETDKYTLPQMVEKIDAIPSGGGYDYFSFDEEGNLTGNASYVKQTMFSFDGTSSTKKAGICGFIKTIDLPKCERVETYAFYKAQNFTSLSLAACTKIEDRAFQGCLSLSTMNLPACLTIGSSAFYGCTSLASVDLPVCKTINTDAFYGCTSLASVSLPVCPLVGSGAFQGCTSLASVDLPVCTTINGYAFYGCISLTSVDLPVCTTINSSAFSGCKKLATLILRNTEKVASGSSAALTNTAIASGTGYIYVPDALVDSYKTATNWSTYADQIKPLSELPTS